MSFKYVIAIVRPETVSSLEARLARAHVGGITLTKVKGFGGYKNFFTSDWLSDHVKAEILVAQEQLDEVLDAVKQAAGSTLHGSGIAAVLPVDSLIGLHFDAPTSRSACCEAQPSA